MSQTAGRCEIWVWPNVPKGEWGPRGWNWAHLLAISYPQEPTHVDARRAFRRIWNFVTHLPCVECRGHAVRFVVRHPPDLSSTHGLQAWVWRFHNAVNYRLGKRVVPYEEYLALYADEICWAGLPGGCSGVGGRARGRAP